MSSAISVTYSYIDGAHFFTSEDPAAAGLCAASTDMKDAFDDVAVQLTNLFKLNHGVETPMFKPAVTFEHFLRMLIAEVEGTLQRERKRRAAATLHPSVIAWRAESLGAAY